MKRYIYILLLLCSYINSFGQNNPIQDWMMKGVYRISVETQNDFVSLCGTAFVVDIKGAKYAVTARHIFKDSILKVFPSRDGSLGRCIFTLENGSIKQTFSRTFYFMDSLSKMDIAVAYLGENVALRAIDSGALAQSNRIRIGNYAIYLGFPIMTQADNSKAAIFTFVDSLYFPLVKIGRVCGFSNATDHDNLIIDAMNATGFSGSPVYVYDDTLKRYLLHGVVSGYVPQSTLSVKDKKYVENGQIFANSGLTLCTFSDYIFYLIDKMPAPK